MVWLVIAVPDTPLEIAGLVLLCFVVGVVIFAIPELWLLRNPAARLQREMQTRKEQSEKAQIANQLARLPQKHRANVSVSPISGGPRVLYIPNRRDRYKYRILGFLRGQTYVMRRLDEDWRRKEREALSDNGSE